jgi:hypothetical protein
MISPRDEVTAGIRGSDGELARVSVLTDFLLGARRQTRSTRNAAASTDGVEQSQIGSKVIYVAD